MAKSIKSKIRRKARQVLRAARYLEQEAREYVFDAKDNDEADIVFCGRRAKLLFGAAQALREIVKDGAIYAIVQKSVRS